MKVNNMIKIQFWLKKSDTDQGSLEYITIANPQKVLEGKLAGMFSCQVHLPDKKVISPIYALNPIESLCNTVEFVKVYLQGLINRGYIISEVESREVWKLAKKDPQVNLKEKMDEIKNNNGISQNDKDKILGIMKESFGKIPQMKDKFD